MASDPPKAPPHGGSTPPIRPITPSTSKRISQKIGSWLQKLPSKGKKREVTEPKPVGAEIAQEQSPQATSTTAPETLLVTTESIHIKQDIVNPTRKVTGYDLAITVIEIFQPVVECTEFILPTPVGKALEQLTKVLEVLKVRSFPGYSGSANIWAIKRMVENKEAWKELYEILVDHGEEFNKQLRRLKLDNTKPDEESAILAPLKRYSE